MSESPSPQPVLTAPADSVFVLQSLVKATNPSDYIYHASLVAGLASVKRITDKVNETSREKENEKTVLELQARVEDWKGHVPETFGRLLVDDVLSAIKSGSTRDYHVFLFEKMLLCCKEVRFRQRFELLLRARVDAHMRSITLLL